MLLLLNQYRVLRVIGRHGYRVPGTDFSISASEAELKLRIRTLSNRSINRHCLILDHLGYIELNEGSKFGDGFSITRAGWEYLMDVNRWIVGGIAGAVWALILIVVGFILGQQTLA